MATTRESVDGVADGVSQVVKLAFPQFLVALFVVKTRAPAKTVRDYLAEIRSYIRTGHRPETDSDGARYIDTLEFWKNSHHRLQHEANERIYTRERKPDASRLVETGPLLRQDGEIPPIIHGKGRGIKRKRATVTAIHPETGKQKAVHVPAFPITGSQPSASSSASDASLPNAIYALQNSISASPINPSTTASIILFIISTLRAWFVVANNPFHHGKSPNTLQPTTKGPSSDITRELPSRDESLDSTTARTLFPLVYTAIGRLDDNTNSRFYQNQLIYEIIRLLKDILEQIHHLAGSLSTMKLSHSKNSTAVVPSPPKKPRRSARFGGQNAALSPDQPPPLQQPQLDPKTPANNNDSAIQTLCNILIYAVEALHPEIRPTDGTIEEGWLFFLLQRTSEVIKAFVFGEGDELWNTACDGEHIPPSSTSMTTTTARNLSARQEQRRIKEVQAPYLISLLEKSVSCFKRCPCSSSTSTTSTTTTTTTTKRKSKNLTPAHHLQTLQSTLLTSLFPPTAYPSALTSPAPLPHPQDPGFAIEKWTGNDGMDVADVFKAEVWRLVGWGSLQAKGWID